MSRIGEFRPEDKQKNSLLPPYKKSRSFHEEKEKSLENLIYKKLKKVAELLESLYYNLSDDVKHKAAIYQNLKLLIQDLEVMHNNLKKTPFSFHANQHCIHEMQSACDTIKKTSLKATQLSKIKHALHELDTLLSNVSAPKKVEKTKAPVKKAKKVTSKTKE